MREVFFCYDVYKNGVSVYRGHFAIEIKNGQKISFKYIRELEKEIAKILERKHGFKEGIVKIVNVCYL